jgi:hypothetical protein
VHAASDQRVDALRRASRDVAGVASDMGEPTPSGRARKAAAPKARKARAGANGSGKSAARGTGKSKDL